MYFKQEERLGILEAKNQPKKEISVTINNEVGRDRSFGELSQIAPRHRALVIAIAATESNCNYKVKHPTNETKGIGGIKPSCWDTKNNINSLKAIEEIIIILENQGKTPWEVIKYYKGGKTNLTSTKQCWDMYQRLKGIL